MCDAQEKLHERPFWQNLTRSGILHNVIFSLFKGDTLELAV
jgi:hypothetical protein